MKLEPRNFEKTMKLRVVVARFGELDIAKWWNTRGQLGKLGSAAVRRGLPRTHHFAQARTVFAVADERCREVFDRSDCVTLWRLTEEFEEEFEAQWGTWLDNASQWATFFDAVERVQGADLIANLRQLEVISDKEAEGVTRLKRASEGRAVPIPGKFSAKTEDVVQLAIGFSLGQIGSLAVPYMHKARA